MEDKITRNLVIESANRYLGLPYTNYHGRVKEEGGKLKGKVSCLSFVLYLARDIGLYKTGEVDFNLDRMGRDSNWIEVADTLLEKYFDKIEKEDALKGDLFKMKYLDVDPKAPWHVAIKHDDLPYPRGNIIHAINHSVARGGVVINRLDILEWNRIDSAYRIKGIV